MSGEDVVVANIKIVRETAKTVAIKWRDQYSDDGGTGWGNTSFGPTEEVYKRLLALGDSDDTDKIEAIIGNRSWTHYLCIGCLKRVPVGIQMGAGYVNKNVCCFECIIRAHELAILDGSADEVSP